MTQRSYIAATHDRETDQILVWERPVAGGERTVRLVKPPRYFFVPDENGKQLTITNRRVSKVTADSEDEHKALCRTYKERYESDVQPLARVLMDLYYDVPTPVVHHAFLDIEVDYNPKVGFSSPENPYAPINAITIYQSWVTDPRKRYLTYAVPPKGWAVEAVAFTTAIQAMWAEHQLGFEPQVVLCRDEEELLLRTLDDLQDADIVSGWNSEFFDLPYIVKRVDRVLGKRSVGHLSFKGARPPTERMVNRFGSPALTYTLHGRTHLDYLDLFKKFTFEGRTSYSLANIAAEELSVPKLEYEGTLADLYVKNFVHFITYNARDVEVLVKLDQKYKFMSLVNQMAHENTVPFVAILGTVRYVETGIMNRARRVHGLICTDKLKIEEENDKVEGAVVMTPYAGLHPYIGSVDLVSLYPSTARALNMSIETFVGQFDDEEVAWEGVMAGDDREYTFQFADGARRSATGAQWASFIKDAGHAVSAFGTLFDQSRPGMVADTLTFWFQERKRLQAEKRRYGKLAREEQDPAKRAEHLRLEEHYDLLQLTKKIQLNSTYGALLNEAFRFGRREIGASVTGSGRQITTHMVQTIAGLLTGEEVRLMKRFTPGEVDREGAELRSKEAYDALTNGGQKYRERRGRNEGRKMTEPYAKALLEGDMEYLMSLPQRQEYTLKFSQEEGKNLILPLNAIYWPMNVATKTHCTSIIYGDTDSCYFRTGATNYEDAVTVADEVAEATNASFPDFMRRAFNCRGGNELLIKASREIVGERALFMFAKKKYTIKVVNLDGVDLRDKPKLKSMGSEIKKADTPKVIQAFLKELMDLVLSGEPYAVLERFVNEHRGKLIHNVAPSAVLQLAPAKQVNNLDALYAQYRQTEKVGLGRCKLPGHVRAAINYNELIERFDPEGAKPLRAGDKAAILYVNRNEFNMTTIGFPAELTHLPAWFDEHFSVDMDTTEKKMIDSKIDGIFEALNLEVPTPQTTFINSVFNF